MSKKIEKYLYQMEKMPGASQFEIQATESELGIKFPQEYVDFLLEINGAEGPIGEEAYLVLWSSENIKSLNKAYKVREHAPYLTLFGSDGGDMGFGFDERSTSPIVEISYIDIGIEEPNLLSETFYEFLEFMYCLMCDLL